MKTGINKVLARHSYTTTYRSVKNVNGHIELLIVRDFTGKR